VKNYFQMFVVIIFMSTMFLTACASEKQAGSCLDIKNNNPKASDGIYEIDPDGIGNNQPFKVYCDMTREGGGWTLYANHTDEINKKVRKLVTPSKFAIMTNSHWIAVREKMSVGMMFVDIYDCKKVGIISTDKCERISTISKSKLTNKGNCISVQNVDSLINNSGYVFHHEKSGCDGRGQDYSLIWLAGKKIAAKDITSDKNVGAALYQMSFTKFDKWPYHEPTHSYHEQNILLYFIK
jgi:hypothetical protein